MKSIVLGMMIALLTGPACTPTASSPAQEAVKPQPDAFVPVRVVMTVDWEGRDLDPEALVEMQRLRRDYPQVPILHYLNAAYFTKQGIVAAEVRAKIRGVLLPHDQLGLHIHAWKSLFTAAGVRFRDRPSLANGDVALTAEECAKDCGHAVPISAYTEAELRQVIRYSVTTLEAQGFGRATQFRAGAWMLSEPVAAALVAEGFIADSSAVPPPLLAPSKWGDKPLYFKVKELWANINTTSQPYAMATAHGPLLEVPDNGCLADYMTGPAMLDVIAQNVALARQTHRPRTVVIGFHQETAKKFLPRIRDALAGLTLLNKSGTVADLTGMPVQLAE